MLASPLMTPIDRKCGTWGVCSIQAPHANPKNCILGACKTLMHRNLEIFRASHHWHTNSRMLFQKWSNPMQDKWPKGRVAFLPLPEKENILHHLVDTLKWFSSHFKLISHYHSSFTISKFCPNQFRFGGFIATIPFSGLLKWLQYRLCWANRIIYHICLTTHTHTFSLCIFLQLL